MPLSKFILKPGVNKEVTDFAAQGQWVDSDNVRFFNGSPQKIKGWEKFTSTTLVGVVRAQHAWRDLDGERYNAFGTNKKLYVYYQGNNFDITPIRATNTAVTNVFTTTTGSANVTVSISSHGARTGDFVTFSDTTSLGAGTDFTAGDFDAEFQIQGLANNNAFYIEMPSNETGAGITGSGTTTAAFQINSGEDFGSSGYGWGTDAWGAGQWGVPSNQIIGTDVFTTTTGSAAVTCTFVDHGLEAGDSITFFDVTLPASGTSYDASDFQTSFTVTSVTDDDNFVITLSENETDTGLTTQGDATLVKNLSSKVFIEARQWSLDNFGQNLIATVKQGGTYQWVPSNGVNTRAQAVNNAPTASRFSLVSTPDRHLVLFGTETTIGNPNTQDELFLRFSDQENITEYTPQATNTAGSLRIADGSKIIAAVRSRGQILVYTDTSLHSLQYIGPPFTFGLRQLGENCGAIGQNAVIDLNGVAFWMSQDSFYLFDGAVRKIPCLVNSYVFNNIDLVASQNVYAAHNGEFNEVIWFYARTVEGEDSSQINACVVYNYLEQTWWTGSLARTSFIDKEVFDNPIATEYNANLTANATTINGLSNGASILYIHEVGNDADGQPITAYVQSGANPIGEGDNFAFVKKIIPDFQDQEGTVNLDLEFKRYPNDANVVTKTASFTPTTEKVDTRGRGRQFVANVYSTTAGTSWRLGAIRFDVQPDGMR